MKKLLSLLILMFSLNLGFFAQESGQFNGFSGVVFGSEAGLTDKGFPAYGPGLNVGLEYFFIDRFSLSPSFSYFFEDKANNAEITIRNQLSVLNLDGRHYFHTKKSNIYGFFGASILFQDLESTTKTKGLSETIVINDPDFGLGFGVGLIRPFSEKLSFGTQLKYQAEIRGEGVVQIVLNASINYSFN